MSGLAAVILAVLTLLAPASEDEVARAHVPSAATKSLPAQAVHRPPCDASVIVYGSELGPCGRRLPEQRPIHGRHSAPPRG